MIIIEQKPGIYGIYDPIGKEIIQDHLILSKVIDYLLEAQRDSLTKLVQDYKSPISWNEALVFAGDVECCDCGEVVEKYNSKWPMEKQRCNRCLT